MSNKGTKITFCSQEVLFFPMGLGVHVVQLRPGGGFYKDEDKGVRLHGGTDWLTG